MTAMSDIPYFQIKICLGFVQTLVLLRLVAILYESLETK